MALQVTIMGMDSFAGNLAVATGGGSGIGRELVRQLGMDDDPCRLGSWALPRRQRRGRPRSREFQRSWLF